MTSLPIRPNRPGVAPRPRPIPRPRPTAGPTTGPTPSPQPTTFTLTTNIEVVPSTGTLPANSIVNGVINGANSTFQTGDIINGNLTSEAKITVAANAAAPGPVVQINTLGDIDFRLVDTATLSGVNSVNAALWTNVAEVSNDSSLGGTTLNVGNADINSVYAIKNTANGGSDLTIAQFRNASGLADTAKLLAVNTGVATDLSQFTLGSGVESVVLETTGVNFVEVNPASSTEQPLSIVGKGSGTSLINIDGLLANGTTTAPSSVDFSQATGPVGVVAGAFGIVSSNTIVRTYKGGQSTADALELTLTGNTLLQPSVTGFEILDTKFDTGSFLLNLASTSGVTALGVSGSTVAANVSGLTAATPSVFTDATNTSSVTFNYTGAPAVTYDVFAASAGNTSNSAGTVFTGVSSLTVNSKRGLSDASTAARTNDLVSLNPGSATSLSLNTSGAGTATVGLDVGTITSSTLQTISGSGAGPILFDFGTGPVTGVLSTVNFGSTSGANNVDLSGIKNVKTGASAPLDVLVAGVTYIGGAGKETVSGTQNNDVITPGGESDQVTAGTGADLVNLGNDSKSDVVVQSKTSGVSPSAVSPAPSSTSNLFANGTTISFANGVDVITGTTSTAKVGNVVGLSDSLTLNGYGTTTLNDTFSQLYVGTAAALSTTAAADLAIPGQLLTSTGFLNSSTASTNAQLFYLQGTFSGTTFVVNNGPAGDGVSGGTDFLLFGVQTAAEYGAFTSASALQTYAGSAGIVILDQA